MNKIYKYRLPRDGQVVTVDDYVIEWLAVANQDDLPIAWAVVDVDMPKGQRVSQIVAWGTGWDLPDEVWMDCEYIGTCEDRYGYVWHYFVESADSGSLSATTSDSAYVIPSGWADTITISLDDSPITYVTGNCTDGACATATARLLRV